MPPLKSKSVQPSTVGAAGVGAARNSASEEPSPAAPGEPHRWPQRPLLASDAGPLSLGSLQPRTTVTSKLPRLGAQPTWVQTLAGCLAKSVSLISYHGAQINHLNSRSMAVTMKCLVPGRLSGWPSFFTNYILGTLCPLPHMTPGQGYKQA